MSFFGICHDRNSSSYSRNKNFTAFDSIAACVEAGGRLPKYQTKQIDEATETLKHYGDMGVIAIIDYITSKEFCGFE